MRLVLFCQRCVEVGFDYLEETRGRAGGQLCFV